MNHHLHSPTPDPPVPSRQCALYADLLPVLDEPETDPHAAAAARTHLAGCAYCQARMAMYAQLEIAIARTVGPSGTPRRRTEDIMRDLLHGDSTTSASASDSISDQDCAPEGAPAGTPLTPGAVTPSPRRSALAGAARRRWSGLAALAAVLAVALLAAALFAGHIRGTAGPGTASPGAKASPTPNWNGRGSQTSLASISMVSATEGWAVGSAYPANGTNGDQARVLLLHYQQGVWSSTRLDISGQVNSVAMVSASDGWAVGDNGLLLHYDGTAWRQVASSIERTFAQVQMLSGTDGWAVGNDLGIYHYDGHAWTAQPLPASLGQDLGGDAPFMVSFSALSMLSPTDGWAIGTYPASASATSTSAPGPGLLYRSSVVILRYHNGIWTVDTTIAAVAAQSLSVQSIAMVSDTEGWATGSADTASADGHSVVQTTPLLLHYTHGAWHQMADPLAGTSYHPEAFTQVAMRSATDGWITVSQSAPAYTPLLLHYDGARWNAVALPDIPHSADWYLTGIAFTPVGDIWIAGVRLSDATEGVDIGGGGYTPTITPVLLHQQQGIWSVVMS